MELKEAYPSIQNGNSAKLFEKTAFSELDVQATSGYGVQKLLKNEVQQFHNNGSVDCRKNLRRKQQQEDRILYRHVPKKVIDDGLGAAAVYNQPSFKLLDLDFDGKFRVRFPPADDARSALTLDLESPASQISSLSECSPLASEISGYSPIAGVTVRGEEEDLSPDSGCSMVRSPTTQQPSSAKSPEGSTVLESFSKQTAVSTEEVVVPVDAKLTEQVGDDGAIGDEKPGPHSGSFCEEDEEFGFLRETNVRRYSSVKIPASPDSLCKKKEVRFADALGLDLESVKQIVATTEPPIVPPSALRDLKAWDKPDIDIVEQVLQLCLCFTPPGSSSSSSGTLSKRVHDQKVVLDTVTVDDGNFAVTGSVFVANIAYVKRVFIRLTTNGWLTYSDAETAYLGSSEGGQVDKFLFKINLPRSFGFGSRLEFAICYESVNQVFWDNNSEANYRLECRYRQVS